MWFCYQQSLVFIAHGEFLSNIFFALSLDFNDKNVQQTRETNSGLHCKSLRLIYKANKNYRNRTYCKSLWNSRTNVLEDIRNSMLSMNKQNKTKHTHTYIHICIHTHTCTPENTHTQARVSTCTHTHTCMRNYAHIHTTVHTHTHAPMCICTHTS